jgi:hypothetical protein
MAAFAWALDSPSALVASEPAGSAPVDLHPKSAETACNYGDFQSVEPPLSIPCHVQYRSLRSF